MSPPPYVTRNDGSKLGGFTAVNTDSLTKPSNIVASSATIPAKLENLHPPDDSYEDTSNSGPKDTPPPPTLPPPSPTADSNFPLNLFTDPEKPLKFIKALQYCNSCALYCDPKLVDKSCLFDTNKFEFPQVVRKPYYRNGRSLFMKWFMSSGQGTRHGAEMAWKWAGKGSVLWKEWDGRRRELIKEQNEQGRRGMVVVRRFGV